MGASDASNRPPASPGAVLTSGPGIGAALFMVISVSLFTVSHGLVRGIGDAIHPLQIAFTTSLFSFCFYLPWLIRTRFRLLRTDKIRIHWLRAFFNAGAVCGWYYALTMTPLADAVALSLAGPLAVMLGAVLFLGEAARARRWLAMGFGIAGALLIIRPGFQEFTAGYWFVLFSLLSTAGSRLITKHLTLSESSVSLGAWIALLQVPITFVLAIYFWITPNLLQLALMVGIGLLVGGAHYTLTVAYSRADVGALEPINFLRLVIAALIGYFIFAEHPDSWTWIGGLVIVASTTYIAHREAMRRRSKPS
ncbi:MAG: DMT family transporter [Rhodospirillales bacterium]|nr:DMT family transporter [Rhodospirillales bacterium]